MTLWPYVQFVPQELCATIQQAADHLSLLAEHPATDSSANWLSTQFMQHTYPVLSWMARRAVLCPSLKENKDLTAALTSFREASIRFDDKAAESESARSRFPVACRVVDWLLLSTTNDAYLYAKETGTEKPYIISNASPQLSWQTALLDLLVQFADSAEVVNAGVDSLRKALGPVALPARSLLVVDRYFFSELEKLEDVSKDPADIKVADSPLFHFFSLVSEWRVDVVDVITAKPTTWKDGNFENHGRRITSLLANYELNWRRTLTQPREPFRLNVRFASDRHQVVHDRLYVFGGSRDSIRDKLAAQGVSYFQDEFNKRAYHAALMSQSLGVFKAQQSEDLLSVQAVSSASAAAYLRQMGWAFSRSVTELKSHSNSPSGEYKAAGLTTEIFSNFGHVH